MRLECKNAVADMVESSREERRLTGDSRAHLLLCSVCSERWEAELALAAGLHEFRNLARVQPSFGQRARLRSELLRYCVWWVGGWPCAILRDRRKVLSPRNCPICKQKRRPRALSPCLTCRPLHLGNWFTWSTRNCSRLNWPAWG